MRTSLIEKILTGFLVLIVLIIAGLMSLSLKNMPLVHMSHATAECVKVQSSQNYTCDNLPTKYEVIWVK